MKNKNLIDNQSIPIDQFVNEGIEDSHDDPPKESFSEAKKAKEWVKKNIHDSGLLLHKGKRQKNNADQEKDNENQEINNDIQENHYDDQNISKTTSKEEVNQNPLEDFISDDISAPLPGSGEITRLTEQAKEYIEESTAKNTSKAYRSDWDDFNRWCRMKGAEPLNPSPEIVGLYLADLAAPKGNKGLSVSTIERRLAGISWVYMNRGTKLDRQDRHIATVMAGIRRKHGRPPAQKEAIMVEDILAMLSTLNHDIRGLRDRAILLLGYAGGLRRSEIVGLDKGEDDTPDSRGWVEIFEEGLLLHLNAKTGWRQVEIGRGSSEQTCPVRALEQWLRFAKIDFGPIFVSISRGNHCQDKRLSDKHVARLIKTCVLKSNIRPDIPEKKRLALFSGHSLRAGLASSAQVDERYVQKHLGHASAEMTRRYQRRRDRFQVNLTQAAGL